MRTLTLTLACLSLVCSLTMYSHGASPVDVSSVLAVDDLVAEVQDKAGKLETAVKDDASLKRALEFETLPTDAGTIAVLAQAIVEHKDGKQSGVSAAALRDAAIALGKAEDLKAAQDGVAAIKAALDGKGGDAKAEHAWNELVDMHSLMLEMELRQVKLRRSISRPRRLKDDSSHAAVLIALALAMEADSYGLEGDDLKDWQKWARQYREEAISLTKAMKADDADTAKKLFEKSDVSCEACHKQFRD